MTRKGARVVSGVALSAALLALSACSTSDEDVPAGLELSSQLKTLPEVEAPIDNVDALLPESRIVGYAVTGSRVVVVGVGENGCLAAAKAGKEDADSVYLDLTTVTVSAVSESPTIGRFAEVGMEVRGDDGGELLLKCGVDGIEVCGDLIGPGSEFEGMRLGSRDDCGLVSY